MKKIWSLLSWRNWGIIRYNSIWQNISSLFYIALTEQLFNLAFIGQVGLFFLFSTMMTGYGYLINDLADIELDRRHGKPNVFHSMGRDRAIVTVLVVLAVGFFFGLPFINRRGFALVWLLWIGAATFYSLPPFRLKERGLAGLVATIAAQQTLPIALLFTAFGELMSWGALIFILFVTVRGISSDVSHQMRDWSNDTNTGTTTFAVRYGYGAVQTVYAISLEVERLVLGGVMLLLLWGLPPVTLPLWNWSVALAWPLMLLYVPLFLLTVGRSWRALRQGRLAQEDPYNEERQVRIRDALHVIHHPLPSVLMPLYLAGWLTLFYWPNLIFLLILSLLYGLYSPERWLNIWPLRPLLTWLRTAKV
ncbi:MAG: UbiA family prenyltransferase [Anaerolineae bacterium]|nr:UbiA family prenyltransferase [Anaerolineae bacterium]